MKKRILCTVLCLVTVLSLAACGKKAPAASDGSAPAASSSAASSASVQETPTVQVNAMVLSGPTGVGAAKMMADNAALGEDAPYSFLVAAGNDEVTPALISGEADIACVATNLAGTLYNKDAGVQVLAVNTLGVLYILERGDSVTGAASLAGKTIYATGQGANPEYILNYVLTQNGLDPAKDVDIQWMTPQEVTAKMLESSDGVCMLPVPAATALLLKDSGVRQALDLTAEWDAVADQSLVMGCVVARKQFIEAYPEAVEAFLAEYEQSVSYMKDPANLDDAAELVAQFGITPNAAVAKAAIGPCNLTYLTGDAMRDAIQGYFEILFQANPASIGGSMPDDEFYYLH